MAQSSGYKYPILNSDGSSSSTVADFADTFVRKELFLNAGLWGAGENSGGALGQGTAVLRSSPIQIGLLTNWKQISGSQNGWIATKTDGTLWACGYAANPAGNLGLGNLNNQSSPVQVGLLNNWKLVQCNQTYVAAIKTNGSLWVWGGSGSSGQLGMSNTNSYSSPVQVGSLTDWKQAVISAGASAAIKTDGTIWTWGPGNHGQGNANNYSSPVQLGLLTNWKYVAAGQGFAISLKTDGTLWGWGNNSDGQLGQNNTAQYNSPVQVGSLSTWKTVAAGLYNSAAIKTDGTLWTWGRNSDGQLGDNTIVSKSSPVQIGALTNWKEVSCGYRHISAIKTDGTLWTWGNGAYGALGVGNLTNYSSPVQVGALTSWKQATCGEYNIFAIQSPDLP